MSVANEESKSMGFFKMLGLYLRLAAGSKTSQVRAVFERHGGELLVFSRSEIKRLAASCLSPLLLAVAVIVGAMATFGGFIWLLDPLMPRLGLVDERIINDDGRGVGLSGPWSSRIIVQTLVRTKDPICRAFSCKPSPIGIVDLHGLSEGSVELVRKSAAVLGRGGAMLVRGPKELQAHLFLLATPEALAKIHEAQSLASANEPPRETSMKTAFASAVIKERATGAGASEAMLAGDKAMAEVAAGFESQGYLPAAQRLAAPRMLLIDVSANRELTLAPAPVGANLDAFAARQFMTAMEIHSKWSTIIALFVIVGLPSIFALFVFGACSQIMDKLQTMEPAFLAAEDFLGIARAAKAAPRSGSTKRL